MKECVDVYEKEKEERIVDMVGWLSIVVVYPSFYVSYPPAQKMGASRDGRERKRFSSTGLKALLDLMNNPLLMKL